MNTTTLATIPPRKPAKTLTQWELWGRLLVVPYLSTGATDSARLRRWGMQVIRHVPV